MTPLMTNVLIIATALLQICLELYRKAMEGMRRHMVTRIHLLGEAEPMWVISEVRARKAKSEIDPPGSFDPNFVLTKIPLLEHLTCFVPGLLTLGKEESCDLPMSIQRENKGKKATG